MIFCLLRGIMMSHKRACSRTHLCIERFAHTSSNPRRSLHAFSQAARKVTFLVPEKVVLTEHSYHTPTSKRIRGLPTSQTPYKIDLLNPKPMAEPPNILLFGTGGVGSVYATLLSNAGASVTCVCRSNYKAVTEDGITVKCAADASTRHARPYTVRSVAEAADTHWDYIVVTAKAMPGVAAQLAPAVKPGTLIFLAQNGINIEAEYAELYPTALVSSGVVYTPATQVSPGLAEIPSLESLEMGLYPRLEPEELEKAEKDFTVDPTSPAARLVALGNLFRSQGMKVTVYADVQVRRWTKLMINAALNPTTALSRLRDAAFAESGAGRDKEAWRLMEDLMREITQIAAAYGYTTIGDEEVQWHLARVQSRVDRNAGTQPSMMVDALQRRPMEVEAILGNAYRLAQAKGVDVPCLRVVYVLTRALDVSLRTEEQ